MPLPPVLDVDALLKPISPESPSGPPVPFETRQALRDLRLEVTDPPDQKRKPDWAKIEQLAIDTLKNSSKDLLVAAHLTEALVQRHGFVGARDGFRLLRELLDKCWDRLNPPIDDGDLEVRAGPFQWLDDPEKGARFPTTLRMVPLVQGEGGRFCLLDKIKPPMGPPPVAPEVFNKALLTSSAEWINTTLEQINESLAELRQLSAGLEAKMAAKLGRDNVPGMIAVRTALEDCKIVLEQGRQQRPAEGEKKDTPAEAASTGPTSAPRPAATRREAYAQLAQAAALLKNLEPHSPIPYLIERAVALGELGFPDMIKEFVREKNIIDALNRELGIKEPPPKK